MGDDSFPLLQILEVLTSNPWLPVTALAALVIAALVIVFVTFVFWQLGLKTNLLHRFAGTASPRENASSSNGAQRVEEVKNVGAEVIKSGGKELSFTQKMKEKSTRIVEEAENGEMKQAIEKCKKFMSSVEASNFACKIFVNSWEEIEGMENFEEIVENIGKQLKLPDDDILGIKLSARGGKSRRDYLAFECAMKDEGKVRLHTGGYQVIKNKDDGDKIDFQIALNYMDMSDITLKKLPETAAQDLEKKWFQSCPAVDYEKPEEGEDWNSYFQYKAHKNILKELHE